MSARAIMFQGTGSDVGKSMLVAGFCRMARQRGLRVRPFKPQNMSNNAAVADMAGEAMGGEIGRAQWLQALACGVPPSVDMNPVLLKPQSEVGAQIIVQGRMFGSARARDYQTLKLELMDKVMESWHRLAEGADLLVVEGAGSPAEINLRPRDIANMGFATCADVPVVLIGDIDRGGVIASLAGTHLILPEEDRRMIAGYLINKFRGDISLFDEGLEIITRHTGWRSFGVVPWLKEAALLPAEDSVILDRLGRSRGGACKVAVPVTGGIANFDDLDPLRAEPGLDVVFVKPGEGIPQDAALIVLAGSKTTIGDLGVLRENGWDEAIMAHRKRGGRVAGICGGYQMLGRKVFDPLGIEGSAAEADGLGLLDVETVLQPEKTVRNVAARSLVHDEPLAGYEIHLGATTGPGTLRPAIEIDGRPDGAVSADGHVWGAYLHGIFAADGFRRRLLAELGVAASDIDYRGQIDAALTAIAGHLERHLDCDALLAAAREIP